MQDLQGRSHFANEEVTMESASPEVAAAIAKANKPKEKKKVEYCEYCGVRPYFKTVPTKKGTKRICKKCHGNTVILRAQQTPRRNDKCPCGSGLKYKACCKRRPKLPDSAKMVEMSQNTQPISQEELEARLGDMADKAADGTLEEIKELAEEPVQAPSPLPPDMAAAMERITGS